MGEGIYPEQDLARRLLEAAERATPGPWDREDGAYSYVTARGALLVIIGPENPDDRNLVAEYRSLAPVLARRVKELESALGQLERGLAHIAVYQPFMSNNPFEAVKNYARPLTTPTEKEAP